MVVIRSYSGINCVHLIINKPSLKCNELKTHIYGQKTENKSPSEKSNYLGRKDASNNIDEIIDGDQIKNKRRLHYMCVLRCVCISTVVYSFILVKYSYVSVPCFQFSWNSAGIQLSSVE